MSDTNNDGSSYFTSSQIYSQANAASTPTIPDMQATTSSSTSITNTISPTVTLTSETSGSGVARRGGHSAGNGRRIRGGRKRRGRIAKKDELEESDEEYSFEGTTKSGRKVHKPQQFDPIDPNGERKRSLYHRRDLQTCKVCQRGHSLESNLIVFCDGCNDPYHQLCHDPPIGRMFIEIEEAQWFCFNCKSKVSQIPLEMGMLGGSLTDLEKRTYLLSLPVQHLVEIILMCEQQFPTLPIYSPNIKSILSQKRQVRTLGLSAVQSSQEKTNIRNRQLDVNYFRHGFYKCVTNLLFRILHRFQDLVCKFHKKQLRMKNT
ncbi:hypothetical protein V1514DRAFT_326649 [Lipomyces japonicus]|uniref:uncharacterized protein n=1 Tax=Lipomyces japonicus TaxID=56871 RepID=UPI0034CFFA8E